jgi:AraC-like DNA-binding protein
VSRSTYQELRAGACDARANRELAGWVEAFWTLRSGGEARRILPDGCIDFIFDLCSGQARAVGTMTTSQVVAAPEGARLFGVRFAPGAAAALIGPAAHELTDASAQLGAVSTALQLGLGERVAEARSDAERVALIDEYLVSAGARVRARDARVRRAIERLRATHGQSAVSELAAETNVSERQLERLFHQHVGLRPKAFARVLRMQRALDALEQPDAQQAAAAQLAGFADEAHLVREFRALTGLSPRRLLHERRVGFVQEAAPGSQ